jgi:hypothetical protein
LAAGLGWFHELRLMLPRLVLVAGLGRRCAGAPMRATFIATALANGAEPEHVQKAGVVTHQAL